MKLTTETKVGLFFLISLVALGVMIELVEDFSPFTTKVYYRAYFQSIVGLNPGDPVRVAGVQVGKVEKISIEEGQVRVDFYTDADTRIKKDALAEVRQTNLLGGLFLGIDFGTPGSPPLKPGEAVGSRQSTSIDQMLSRFDRNQERILGKLGDILEQSQKPIARTFERLDQILGKIDRGEGSLGQLVNDPALYRDLSQSVNRLNTLLSRAERGEGSLGKAMTDDRLYEDLARAVTNLRTITQHIEQGRGTLGRMLQDESLYKEAVTALAQIGQIATKANRGEGSLGKLVNDDALYTDAQQTLQRLSSISRKIDEGQGTVGKLINEDKLYQDAAKTLRKVEKAVDGLGDSGPVSALGIVVGTLF